MHLGPSNSTSFWDRFLSKETDQLNQSKKKDSKPIFQEQYKQISAEWNKFQSDLAKKGKPSTQADFENFLKTQAKKPGMDSGNPSVLCARSTCV